MAHLFRTLVRPATSFKAFDLRAPATATSSPHSRLFRTTNIPLRRLQNQAHNGKANSPPRKKRRIARTVLILTATSLGVAYLADRFYAASSCMRSLRAQAVIFQISLDYKLNYRKAMEESEDRVNELHRRNAQRVCDLLKTNGGLYIKIGQSIAMQGALLPSEFQRMFASHFDSAPQDSWIEIEQVARQDFGGRSVEEVFNLNSPDEADPAKGVIDRNARASASIAQVYWARLADGREVAIKVQKKDIAQQVGWDLWSLQLAMDYAQWATGLPVSSLGRYVTQQVMLETDFENEARNAQQMADLVSKEPRLSGRVHIPETYTELSSKRIMTAEWIHGVNLWDKEKLTAPLARASGRSQITPDKGSLELDLSDIMTTVIDLFSMQLFHWGFVHCDPHPGNIFVRRLPTGKPQIVLIDHGLYVKLSPSLRKQYCRFWKAMLTHDDSTLNEIAKSWGLRSPNATADALLMRPYKVEKSTERQDTDVEHEKKQETSAERQERILKEAREMVGDEEHWPQEFVFIERNLGIVQSNNRFLGSPVNRIKRIGLCASTALLEEQEEEKSGFTIMGKWTRFWYHAVFRFKLLTLDLVFHTSRIKQFLGYGQGFEEDLKAAEQKQVEDMKDMVKDVFSVDL